MSENEEGSKSGTKPKQSLLPWNRYGKTKEEEYDLDALGIQLLPYPEDNTELLDELRSFVPNDSDIEETDIKLDAPAVYDDDHLIDDDIREKRKLYRLLPVMGRHYLKKADRAFKRGDWDFFTHDEESDVLIIDDDPLDDIQKSNRNLQVLPQLPPSSYWTENRGWKDKQMISQNAHMDNKLSRLFSTLSSKYSENAKRENNFRRAESSRPANFCSSKKMLYVQNIFQMGKLLSRHFSPRR